jgi:hypothetical protein
MKRISLIVGIAVLAAIAAPLSAQSNGNGGKYGRASGVYDRNGDGVIDNRERAGANSCSWWEVNCNNTNSRTTRTSRSGTDTGWYQIGSDRYGNVIYERSTFDRKGRETIEIARRENNGRFVIIDRRRAKNTQNNGRWGTQNDRRGNRDNNDDDRYERNRR